MAGKPSGSYTHNEWLLMNIVWELKRCAARDACKLAEERHGWAASTTKTYLARLVEKGRLKATRIGNSFLYEPKASLSASLREAADHLLEKMPGAFGGPLLAYMIGKARLGAEDVAELKRVLAEAEDEPPTGDKQP
jgi:predicted transcriptional regulator